LNRYEEATDGQEGKEEGQANEGETDWSSSAAKALQKVEKLKPAIVDKFTFR